MSHTPGPWRYDSGKIWTPRGWWVANVYEDMEEDIKEANGLLLAAAPDLLEAIQGFRRQLKMYASVYLWDKEVHRLLDECDAAIAKARGGK
jgi:hypothetical protein